MEKPIRKVAYLGPEKTFTEGIAKRLFPREELIPTIPIMKVIMGVENRNVDFGVVPLENFYEGEVAETLDTLTECSSTRIIQEVGLEIVHCFGALPGHGTIEQIFSKDQALNQCRKYLYQQHPDAEKIQVGSTSEAANRIVREKLLNSAAIASKEALKRAGLEILAEDICPNNRTKFIVLGRENTEPTGNDRTFLVFHPMIKDRSGTLQAYLGFFSSFGINLDYIQSRPDGNKGYFFYLELTGHQKDEPVKRAIENLRYALDPENKYPDSVKVFGSYPNTHWKDVN